MFEKERDVYILVYGTLKREGYNNASFDLEYVKDVAIEGYEMYDLGWYPCVVPGDGTIQCELMKTSKWDYDRIEQMESGAGYSTVDITIDGVVAKMFIFEEKPNKNKIDNW